MHFPTLSLPRSVSNGLDKVAAVPCAVSTYTCVNLALTSLNSMDTDVSKCKWKSRAIFVTSSVAAGASAVLGLKQFGLVR